MSDLVAEVLAHREPFSVGPASPEMDATEKVLAWAIRYCSDMGAAPSPFEWDAIRAVARLATELQAAREVAQRWARAYWRWHNGHNSKEDFKELTEARNALLARYDEGRTQ